LKSRNAGEWAEFYALIEILSEGKLYSADGELRRLKDNFFPVVSIEMQEYTTEKGNKKTVLYTVDAEKQTVIITSNSSSSHISMNDLKIQAAEFFKIISTRKSKHDTRGAFEVEEINNILKKLGNPVTKQSSSKKADIHIVIHDIMTGFENEVGFSIKSKHSSPATLINASGQTLFQYHIETTNNLEKIESIKSALSTTTTDRDNKKIKIGPKERVKNLINHGFNLQFKTIKSDYFKENIQLIDSSLDIFLAECLKVFMLKKIANVSDIVEYVAKINPCNFTASSDARLLEFYKYKMKRLITDAALGMQPKAPWSGKYDASGGYIVVKETGDVVCYHLYNWNALQDYLYNNLKFETPTSTGTGSKKSFNYALYYNQDDEHYMDICLQLRFK
jgi:hypothetical protein